MGLAASQARFLGLTARKSNVEYQVQQINQQRTALSNEVMGMFQDYNKLEVPTPPIVADYQKTEYKLDSTIGDYKIESFNKITTGEYEGYYDVVLSSVDEVAKAYSYTAKDSVITAQKGENGYSYLNFQIGLDSYIYDENDPALSNITKITENYENYQGLKTIMDSQGLENGTFYMYVKNGVSYYTSENDLNLTAFSETADGKNMYYGDYVFDYLGAQKVTNTINAKAALTQESSGRLSTIQILDCPDEVGLVDKTYSITTSSRDDEVAYEDAMNQYYYEKQLYEREVEKINHKTQELQEEDRTLELKINQLDTEHQTLATEMDSVSKVIEDTMEKVFKTFSS